MKVVVNEAVHDRIKQFYYNAMLKYPNTYYPNNAERDIDKVHSEIDKVGTRLWKRQNSIITRWTGYSVDYSIATKWYFAYLVRDDTVYVIDAENYRNMSDLAYYEN